MQRISLNEADFQKLVRGEIVSQGDLQVALQNIGHQQICDAVCDAIAEAPMVLERLLSQRALHFSRLDEDTEEIRRWIHGVNQHEPSRPGDFLLAFAAAVCRADAGNYPLLRPAIVALMVKFPQYRFKGDL
jgi:hypothetical protein